MKKILITLSCLLAIFGMQAASYLTIGRNDTLMVKPIAIDYSDTVMFRAHFEGRLDQWQLNLTYPDGMSASWMGARQDMNVTYLNSDSDWVYLAVPLAKNSDMTQVSASIWQYGYWDYNQDGVLEPYGTIKWEAGDYANMFEAYFEFEDAFDQGTLIISGTLRSGLDSRGGVISPNPCTFQRNITVIIGYWPGDVNGDEVIDNSDVTALIAYILGNNTTDWDEYQMEAADLNGDGNIDSTDVIILIGMIMG